MLCTQCRDKIWRMRCESETIEIPESVTEIGDLKGDGKTGARGCMMLKRVVLGTYVL